MRSGCEEAAARRAALVEALRAIAAQPAEQISAAALTELEGCSLVDLAMMGAELDGPDIDFPVSEAAIAALWLAMAEEVCHVVRRHDCIIQVTAHEVLDWTEEAPR